MLRKLLERDLMRCLFKSKQRLDNSCLFKPKQKLGPGAFLPTGFAKQPFPGEKGFLLLAHNPHAPSLALWFWDSIKRDRDVLSPRLFNAAVLLQMRPTHLCKQNRNWLGFCRPYPINPVNRIVPPGFIRLLLTPNVFDNTLS